MPRKYRRKNKRNTRTMNGEVVAQTGILTKMLEVEKMQMLRTQPAVPDIPRMRTARDKVYTLMLSINRTAYVTSTTLESDYSLQFQLNDISNYSSFTNIFDTYRIAQVTVAWLPITSGGPQSYICTAIDYDDANTTTLANLLNYDTSQVVPLNQYFERTLQPRLAKAVYSGSAFTSFAQEKNTWVDAASPGVPWYGLKAASPVTNAPITMTPLCTYVLQFKNPR